MKVAHLSAPANQLEALGDAGVRVAVLVAAMPAPIAAFIAPVGNQPELTRIFGRLNNFHAPKSFDGIYHVRPLTKGGKNL